MSNRSVHLIMAVLASAGYTGVVLLLPMGGNRIPPLYTCDSSTPLNQNDRY